MTDLAPTWVRNIPIGDWHIIRAVDDGRVSVHCERIWTTTSDEHEVHDSPPIPDRCSACIRLEVATQTQPVELFQFEMVDDRFDDGGVE